MPTARWMFLFLEQSQPNVCIAVCRTAVQATVHTSMILPTILPPSSTWKLKMAVSQPWVCVNVLVC